jgi:hypothetical protein
VLVAQEHQALSQAARDLGLAYAFTGDDAYARKCAEILLGYAAQYKRYQLKDRSVLPLGDVGRVSAQPLDEARWAIPLAQAYDFVADSGALDASQKRRVERDLLRAAAETIALPPQAVHNIMCWRAAAVGMIGFSIRDAELAYRAIEGEYGIRRQMVQGIGQDGMWYEGSLHYHLFAMEPLAALAECASHFGVDLFSAHFEKMFIAPILAMEPNRGLPMLNDALANTLEGGWPYEVARVHYPDDSLVAWLLSTSVRGGIEPVLYGEADVQPASPPVLTTALFPDAGLAVLRSRGSQPLYVALDYGPHGGWHGHNDKLSFVLFGQGKEMCSDPGAIKYAAPAQEKWYRQTLSHNSVVVDRKSQIPGQGLLDFIHATEHFQLVSASCDNVYPGVLHDRFVGVIGERCVLVVDRLLGAQERTYDWVLHGIGELQMPAKPEPIGKPLGSSDGYDMLTNVARVAVSGPFRAEFADHDGTGLSVFVPMTKDVEFFTAMGLGRPVTQTAPMIIARQKAYGACFVTLLEPWRGSSTIEEFTAGPAQAAGGKESSSYDVWFEIKGKDWAAQGIVSYNGEKKSSPSGLETDGRAAIVLSDAGAPAAAVLAGGERLSLKGAPVEPEPSAPVINQE